MPIISIISQPPTNALKAAYRPIVFMVRASRTDGNAKPPIMYCDVYINGIFYKTQERTQYEVLNSTNSDWKFDIQDACQEVLSATIQVNGGSAIIQDSLSMKQVYCKFRSSGYDINGFITPEGTKPVQGTGTVLPVAGTGTQSSSFFAVMSTLQHDQNQDAATHLGFYKTGTWDANVFPLSHRKPGYKVCAGDSDYFPIVNLSTKNPLCIQLFYKNRGDASFSSVSQCGEASCTAVSYSPFSYGNAIVGAAYSKTIPLSGTAPFTLISFSSAATWLLGIISGSNLVISGTPAIGDVGSSIAVNFMVKNACGTIPSYKTINVVADCVAVNIAAIPDNWNAYSGQPYNAEIILGGTGPYSIDSFTPPAAWLEADINDNVLTLHGTPGIDDLGANAFSFTVSNACGSVVYPNTIEVIQSGSRFGDTTFNFSDTLNDYETANIIGGEPGATITFTVDLLTNNNGGEFKVNGLQVFQGNTFNVVLDGSGNGSFEADIEGLNHPSTVINAHIIITGVTSGTIGTPNFFQTSKAF